MVYLAAKRQQIVSETVLKAQGYGGVARRLMGKQVGSFRLLLSTLRLKKGSVEYVNMLKLQCWPALESGPISRMV